MEQDKLKKQLELLHSDLKKCNNRCNKIAKQLDIEPNNLIQYAMEQTKEILDYIESLKNEE
jgi:hypothetical protein